MNVKSYFESERRKKQITWTLIILGFLRTTLMTKSRLPPLRSQALHKSRWFRLKPTMNSIKRFITIAC